MHLVRFLTSISAALAVSGAAEQAWAQSCPAEPGPVTCSYASRKLTIDSAAGRLVLSGARWTANASRTRFTTSEGFTLSTPAGALPIPGVGAVTVECSPAFAITGELTSLPNMGSLFPMASVSSHAPTVSIGMGTGETLAALGAPVQPCRTYAWFALDSSVYAVLEETSLTPYAGDQIIIAVDPNDPGFYVSVGGQHLSDATLGFVYSAGFGFSRNGLIPWQSVVPLPLGPAGELDVASFDAHVWVAAMVGLLPLPNSPIQLYIDGVVAADLGPWPDAAEAVIAGLVAGRTSDVAQIVSDRYQAVTSGDVLDEITIGANAKILTLWIHEFGLELGKGSFVLDQGRLSFGGRQRIRRFRPQHL